MDKDMHALWGESKSLPILYIRCFYARMHHSNIAVPLRPDVHFNSWVTCSLQQIVGHDFTSTRHTDCQASR
jgi:hypothetical protein